MAVVATLACVGLRLVVGTSVRRRRRRAPPPPSRRSRSHRRARSRSTPARSSLRPDGHDDRRQRDDQVGIRPSADRRLRVRFTETRGRRHRGAVGGRRAGARWRSRRCSPARRSPAVSSTSTSPAASTGSARARSMTIAVIALDPGRRARERHHDDRNDQSRRHDRTGRRHSRETRRRGRRAQDAHADSRSVERNVPTTAGHVVDVVAARPGRGCPGVDGRRRLRRPTSSSPARRCPAPGVDRHAARPARLREAPRRGRVVAREVRGVHARLPEPRARGAAGLRVVRGRGGPRCAGGEDARRRRCQAGAFRAAVSAAALMSAIAQTGQLLPVLLAQGAPAVRVAGRGEPAAREPDPGRGRPAACVRAPVGERRRRARCRRIARRDRCGEPLDVRGRALRHHRSNAAAGDQRRRRRRDLLLRGRLARRRGGTSSSRPVETSAAPRSGGGVGAATPRASSAARHRPTSRRSSPLVLVPTTVGDASRASRRPSARSRPATSTTRSRSSATGSSTSLPSYFGAGTDRDLRRSGRRARVLRPHRRVAREVRRARSDRSEDAAARAASPTRRRSTR